MNRRTRRKWKRWAYTAVDAALAAFTLYETVVASRRRRPNVRPVEPVPRRASQQKARP